VGEVISFGVAPTSFGDIRVSITPREKDVLVEWSGQWFKGEPMIDIWLPGFGAYRVLPGTNFVELKDELSR
jgi:hypothetical protein